MRNEVFNILPLTIKKKWFDMILNGEKKEEYREIKPFYDSRLSNTLGYPVEFLKFEILSKTFQVQFKNGYSRNCPQFICDCQLSIGCGKEEWGAISGVEYYILHITRIYRKRGEDNDKK